MNRQLFFLRILILGIGLFCGASTQAQTLSDLNSYEVEEQDIVYARVDGTELLARIYRPKKSGVLPAVVEVHGGAWNLYDRTAGELYNRALASSGLFVMAVDFRQGPDFKHPLGSRDAVAALRYLKSHASALQIDPASIGIMGSSSGGHLALLAGIKPNADLHKGTAILSGNKSAQVHDDIDAAVRYIIALWPVSDPKFRYDYAARMGRDELRKYHLGYFADEAAMRDASIQRAIEAGEAATTLPALLVVQPGADTNIPLEMTEALLRAYQKAGGKVDYAFYPGQAHAFAHRPSPATDDCIRTMRDFIDRQLQAAN